METKYCHQCSKYLPLKLFNKSKKTKDGLYSPCKYCLSDKRKSRATTVSSKIEILVNASKVIDGLLPCIHVDCDYGDYTKTKLYQNAQFVAGDGGYQEYINKINIAQG